jgi:WD40 repeat protein
MLVSCSYDDTMKVWQDDDDDWVCTETIKGHQSTVWDATFEPTDGEFLVSCSDDHSIIMWRLTNANAMPAPGDEINRFVQVAKDTTTHTRTIYSVDWSRHKDSALLATGSADDSIRVFKVNGIGSANASQESPSIELQACMPKAHSSDVNCVKWHPSESSFASCGDDGVIRIWSYTS